MTFGNRCGAKLGCPSQITNVPAGCGLIRCAGSIVPFTNSFPKNTRLYQLMTTKPDEALR